MRAVEALVFALVLPAARCNQNSVFDAEETNVVAAEEMNIDMVMSMSMSMSMSPSPTGYGYSYFGTGEGKGKGKGKGHAYENDTVYYDEEITWNGKGKGKGKGSGGNSPGGKGNSRKGKGKGMGMGRGKGMSDGIGDGYGKGKGIESEEKVAKGFRSGGRGGKGKGKGKGYLPTITSSRVPTTSPTPTVSLAPFLPGNETIVPGLPDTVAPIVPGSPTATPMTSPPTPSPQDVVTPTVTPTSAPTIPVIPSVDIVLAPFSLFYTIEQTRIPDTNAYEGLDSITAIYLESYMMGIFEMSDEVTFLRATTDLVGNDFRLGQPVRADYNTTISVAAQSTLIPSESDLDALLGSAFQGSNAPLYLSTVQDLPDTNIFSTTTEITFGSETTTTPPSSQIFSTTRNDGSSKARPVGIALTFGTGALILIATGFFLMRQSEPDDDAARKYLHGGDGHITVAGDTYAGASSQDSQSGLHRLTRACDTGSEWSYQESDTRRSTRPSSPATTLEGVQENCSEDGTEALQDVDL